MHLHICAMHMFRNALCHYETAPSRLRQVHVGALQQGIPCCDNQHVVVREMLQVTVGVPPCCRMRRALRRQSRCLQRRRGRSLQGRARWRQYQLSCLRQPGRTFRCRTCCGACGASSRYGDHLSDSTIYIFFLCFQKYMSLRCFTMFYKGFRFRIRM